MSIDLLIGADSLYEMLWSGRRTHPDTCPVLQETVFRLTLSGRSRVTATIQNEPQHALLLQKDNSLEHNLLLFRALETVDQSTKTAEQHACVQHFITPTTQQEDGGFVARLPTKEEPKQLGSFRLSSERRLHAIERRLEQELKDLYHLFMKKCEQLGHMKPLKSQERKQPCDFLPLHPVFKETRTTPPKCN